MFQVFHPVPSLKPRAHPAKIGHLTQQERFYHPTIILEIRSGFQVSVLSYRVLPEIAGVPYDQGL